MDVTAKKPIRNSAKALIIHGDRFLAIRKKQGEREYFVLPGGGQEREETLADAVKRECKEEVNADVEVRELLFVREYIGRNHEFARFDSDLHQVEFVFRCEVANERDLGAGSHPDNRQVGVAWMPIAEARSTELYPKAFRDQIADLNAVPAGTRNVYLGDVN
ncbi:MAG TPA: NUDIX domain-containing protein [Spirochaetia bacterium]|nr:NUDIX domain-containing protein [Spirochaetia bacterium]